MWRASSYVLLAAAVLLAALLIAPWPPMRLREQTAALVLQNVQAPVEQTEGPILKVPSESVAALFGWRPSVARSTPEAPPKAEPAEATWMTYMGYVLKEGGIRFYVFKDRRSGQVHTLSIGQSSSGWILKTARSEGFILEFQGIEYIIKGDRTTR